MHNIQAINRLSIISLLNNLLCHAPKSMNESDCSDAKIVPTTVRLEPRVRRFVNFQAENLGISVQEFIALTLRSVMVATDQPFLSSVELMLARFNELFRLHSISIIEIPQLFNSGQFRRSDFLSESSLIDRIDSSVCARLVQLFHIDLEWINGKSNVPYRKIKSWHDSNNTICKINEHRRLGNDIRVIVVVSNNTSVQHVQTAEYLDGAIEPAFACVVLQVQKRVNGVCFTTFDVMGAEYWNGKKCSLNLMMLMKYCTDSHVILEGGWISVDCFLSLSRGECVAAAIMRQSRPFRAELLLQAPSAYKNETQAADTRHE